MDRQTETSIQSKSYMSYAINKGDATVISTRRICLSIIHSTILFLHLSFSTHISMKR